MKKKFTVLLLFITLFGCKPKNQSIVKDVTNALTILSKISANYVVTPNIVYYKTDSTSVVLDVIYPVNKLGEPPWTELQDSLRPVVLNIHGGKWMFGDKQEDFLGILPYIDKGWSVVNINYRLVDEAPLPLPISDCRQALHWIYENANSYNFDTNNIYVSGGSSGGHYALMTGILKNNQDKELFDVEYKHDLKVKAIINWYGQYYFHKADQWNGKVLDWEDQEFLEILTGDIKNAQHILDVSTAINYVNKNTPPIISIHGDKDVIVPFEQSVLLHKDLSKLKVTNKLVTMKNAKHGNFTPNQLNDAYSKIFEFINALD